MKRNYFAYLIPAAAIPAMVLHRELYRVAVDGKGLLVRLHPLGIILWALAAAAVLAAAAASYCMRGSGRYEDNFRRSILAALGCAVMAAGIAHNVYRYWDFEIELLANARAILGWASVACLLAAAVCRALGKKPSGLFYGVSAAFFAVQLIMSYKLWSSNPQFTDFGLELFAGVCLLLFFYYQCAFCVGIGSRGRQLFYGLAGSFFCLAGSVHSDTTVLWAAGAIYLVTNLAILNLPKTETEGE